MNKRPKSREETPKEGSDSARRYRTATICDRDAQSARPFESFSVQKIRESGGGAKRPHSYISVVISNSCMVLQQLVNPSTRPYYPHREFVIDRVIGKYTSAQADSKVAKSADASGIAVRTPCAISWIGLGKG